jgi:hypothetical protein
MLKWKDYNLNGVKITIVLDTQKHRWKVYFGTQRPKPDMELTQAKGDAVIELLETIKEIETSARV